MSLITFTLLSMFVCIVSLWIRWRRRRMRIFEKYGIPGPKPNFLTGNLIEFNRKRDKCFDEWMEKYGKIFGFFLGGKPWIVCCDVELLKLIQIKEFKKFINRDLIMPDAGMPHHLILESLILLKDEKWKNVRNIISPNFSSGKIKMIKKPVIDSIKIFLEKILENKEEPIEIYKLYKNMNFDIISKTAMGIQTNVQNEEKNKLVQSLKTFVQADTVDILAIISVWFPEIEPIPMYLRRIVAWIKYIMNFACPHVVMNTSRNIINYRKKSGYHQPDLLQLMIDAEEESNGVKTKLTTDCIIGNATLFMLAGFDSVSIPMAWCTYYLAKYPEVQEKVRLEIYENVENNKELEYTDLLNLKYLDQVISETLRLHPFAVLAVNRVCSEDFHYKNITIPKNVTVLIPLLNLHKDPNYWKEPEKFDPERFSNKNTEKIDPFMYQPFGAGPRNCVGMKMAQTVMKLTLANLIRNFKIKLHGNRNAEQEYSFFLIRPKHGVTIEVSAVV